MLIIEQTKERSLTDWNQLNWTAIERNVKRLQGRIFRAVRAGNVARAKSLQKLLARSSSAKLLAIRTVTQQNRGKRTPGVDGVVCKTPEDRLALFRSGLSFKGYCPKPVRRIFIPKKKRQTAASRHSNHQRPCNANPCTNGPGAGMGITL